MADSIRLRLTDEGYYLQSEETAGEEVGYGEPVELVLEDGTRYIGFCDVDKGGEEVVTTLEHYVYKVTPMPDVEPEEGDEGEEVETEQESESEEVDDDEEEET